MEYGTLLCSLRLITGPSPRQFGSSWLSPSPIWSPKFVTPHVPTVQAMMRRATIGVADSFVNVARTLPPHLLLSLIYRVAVLHLAARIVPVIRKSSMGWDDGMEVNDAGVTPGFWDGRSLRQEPAVSKAELAALIIPVEYANNDRRPFLPPSDPHRSLHPFALYVALTVPVPMLSSAVLDAGSQTWWRWVNIAVFLAVWSLELLLDAEGDDDSVTRWKVD